MTAKRGIRLVPADVADAALFARLEQGRESQRYVLADTRSRHAKMIDAPDTVYLRIEAEGETVGFILLVLEPRRQRVEFRRIVVGQNDRGIGQAAIRLMEQYCADVLKTHRVWLDVFEDNHRAIHVYRKLGYRLIGRSSDSERPLMYFEKSIPRRGLDS